MTSRIDGPAARRAAYLAFGWVLAFLAWHVVWAVTGLEFPSPSRHHGSERVALDVFTVVLLVMVAVGVVLPIALARRWGPRWPLLATAWAGCGLLAARAVAGLADDLLRLTGLRPDGLTGLTTAQVMGSAHPSTWAVVASGTTDVLFALGALAFGAAAHTCRRVTVRR